MSCLLALLGWGVADKSPVEVVDCQISARRVTRSRYQGWMTWNQVPLPKSRVDGC